MEVRHALYPPPCLAVEDGLEDASSVEARSPSCGPWAPDVEDKVEETS